MYAKIKSGVVSVYPYNLRQLSLDNPNVSFPSIVGEALMGEYGVFPVTPTTQPAPTVTQDPIEQTPQLINGKWTQVWSMVNVSAEEASVRQLEAADRAETLAIRADTFVTNFIAMTPAQVAAYVENNTANLAQVRSLMTKMAVMLLMLAKREYR